MTFAVTHRSVAQVLDSAVEVGRLADQPREIGGHGQVEVRRLGQGDALLLVVGAVAPPRLVCAKQKNFSVFKTRCLGIYFSYNFLAPRMTDKPSPLGGARARAGRMRRYGSASGGSEDESACKMRTRLAEPRRANLKLFP